MRWNERVRRLAIGSSWGADLAKFAVGVDNLDSCRLKCPVKILGWILVYILWVFEGAHSALAIPNKVR